MYAKEKPITCSNYLLTSFNKPDQDESNSLSHFFKPSEHSSVLKYSLDAVAAKGSASIGNSPK